MLKRNIFSLFLKVFMAWLINGILHSYMSGLLTISTGNRVVAAMWSRRLCALRPNEFMKLAYSFSSKNTRVSACDLCS